MKSCAAIKRSRHRIANAIRRTLLRFIPIYRSPICWNRTGQRSPSKLQVLVLGCSGVGKTTFCLNLCTPGRKSAIFQDHSSDLVKDEFASSTLTFNQQRSEGFFRSPTFVKYVELGGKGELEEEKVNELFASSHGVILLLDLSIFPCQCPSTLILKSTIKHKFLIRKPILVVGAKRDLCTKDIDETAFIQAYDLTETAAKYKTRMLAMTSGLGTKKSDICDNVSWFIDQILDNEAEIQDRILSDMETLKAQTPQIKLKKTKKLRGQADFLLQKLLRESRGNDDTDSSEDGRSKPSFLPHFVVEGPVTLECGKIAGSAASEENHNTEIQVSTDDKQSHGDGHFQPIIVADQKVDVEDDQVKGQINVHEMQAMTDKLEEIYSALKSKADSAGNSVLFGWASEEDDSLTMLGSHDEKKSQSAEAASGDYLDSKMEEAGNLEAGNDDAEYLSDQSSSASGKTEIEVERSGSAFDDPSWVEELDDSAEVESANDCKYFVTEDDNDSEPYLERSKSLNDLTEVDLSQTPLHKVRGKLNLLEEPAEVDESLGQKLEMSEDTVYPFTSLEVLELNVAGGPDLFSTPVESGDPGRVMSGHFGPTSPSMDSPRCQPQVA